MIWYVYNKKFNTIVTILTEISQSKMICSSVCNCHITMIRVVQKQTANQICYWTFSSFREFCSSLVSELYINIVGNSK